MNKIPVLFKRDVKNLAIPELADGCEWLLGPENGLMTIKIDGICVKVSFDQAKNGWAISKRLSDINWFDVSKDSKIESDMLIWQAFDAQNAKTPGFFEVYGKGIKGNPHGADGTYMIKISPVDYTLIVARGNTKVARGPMHTAKELFDNIRAELEESPEIEGFVFHLENADMALAKACKIRKKDFGIAWPSKTETLVVV